MIPSVGMLDRSTGVLHRPTASQIESGCGQTLGDPITLGPLRDLVGKANHYCPVCWLDAEGLPILEEAVHQHVGAGPLQAFFVNRREATLLREGVALLLFFEQGVLSNEARALADGILVAQDGLAGRARLDQAVAKAADDVPVLRSLVEALSELCTSLRREPED